MSSEVERFGSDLDRGPINRAYMALLRRLASNLRWGSLRVILPSGAVVEHRTDRPGQDAVLQLRRWRALRRLLLGGDVAFGEAYIDGDWTSPDPVALLRLAAENDAALAGATDGPFHARWLNRLLHRLRDNTLAGSRRNIVEHYDLGNAFYALWLDPSMTYSSALYAGAAQSLEEAQAAKRARVVDWLETAPGMDVLEIGCGWGSLAAEIARRGSTVTGLTLSPAQRDHAAAMLREAGLAERAALRLEDYREIEGHFDRIVSIEMFEAVGEPYWPIFFDRIRELLRPGGIAVLQIITIADARFPAYRQRPDFIQRHVFPGGMLPSPSILRDEIARAGFVLEATETFGESYARTLAEWRQRFASVAQGVSALGFSDRFRRLWDYYLAYCEAGFRVGAIDVGLWRLRAPH